MSFKNKVALVTGGSSGIGAATAILFAKAGAYIAIVGRNEAKLKNVEKEISKVGSKPLVLKVDVSEAAAARTIVQKTVDKFGKLDILVNNAGIMRYISIFDENLLQTYDDMMNTNLRATVLLTNLAAPHLVKTKGSIVNISSVAGSSPLGQVAPGLGPYGTTKAGMDHFSRVSAFELAEKGVRVNIISPGPVKTDLIENAGRDADWEALGKGTPLTTFAMPEEVAELVLYLASDKAKSITGSNYFIDSGIKLIC